MDHEVSQDKHWIIFSIIQPSTIHSHSYCETYSRVHFSIPTDIHPGDGYWWHMLKWIAKSQKLKVYVTECYKMPTGTSDQLH
jgi:hypothetical protein